jgi:hypothetical protein
MDFNFDYDRNDGVQIKFYKVKKIELLPDDNKGLAVLHCYVNEAAFLAGKSAVMIHTQEFALDGLDVDLGKAMNKWKPVIKQAFIDKVAPAPVVP